MAKDPNRGIEDIMPVKSDLPSKNPRTHFVCWPCTGVCTHQYGEKYLVRPLFAPGRFAFCSLSGTRMIGAGSPFPTPQLPGVFRPSGYPPCRDTEGLADLCATTTQAAPRLEAKVRGRPASYFSTVLISRLLHRYQHAIERYGAHGFAIFIITAGFGHLRFL